MTFRSAVVLILISLFALVACGPAQNSEPSDWVSDNIVGGKNTGKKSSLAKSQVFIVLENESGSPETCTGTFIGSQFILTAAHCVNSDVSTMSLYSGIEPINKKSRETLTVDKVYVHPRYRPESKTRNDIAIIQIKEVFKYPKYIMQVPDRHHELRINDGLREKGYAWVNREDTTLNGHRSLDPGSWLGGFDDFWAAGYGRTDGLEDNAAGQDELGILRQVNLNDKMDKKKRANEIIIDQRAGMGVCFGDSGGPLIAKIDHVNFIVGVASGVFDDSTLAGSGPKDACLQKSVFMDVRFYSAWINRVVSSATTLGSL